MNYLKDSFEEVKKVTWPTTHRAITVCVITLIFTLITTLLITGLDFGFSEFYQKLIDLSPKAGTSVTQTPDLSDIDLSSAIQATDAEGNPVSLEVTPSTTDAESAE